MIIIKKLISLLLILLFLSIPTYLKAIEKIRIIKKVNNEIITNIDIKNEYNYLIALNNNLKNLSLEDGYKISEDSLIREKIKLSEIIKFISLDEFIEESTNEKIINNIIKNILINLNLSNSNEFENYLSNFDLKIDDVRKKITIEVIWNQIIGNKFKDQVNINEVELKKKIKDDNLDSQNIIEYDLSEIVFQANNQEDLNKKITEIEDSIKNLGFKTAANIFSISDTSKIGGSIGKIKENQLSDNIRNELTKIDNGEFTKPINVGSRFLIIFINEKNTISQKLDENQLLKNMIEYEKKNQFENFSQIYFDKIKLNSQIQ
jgi:peptidyl-prolyl cis-trans isomerase SurA